MNMVTDSGTAKVKQRPTVKLAIPFQRNSKFAVPTPTLPDRTLFSKIPRTSVMSGNDMKLSDNTPNVGDHGQSVKMRGDDWIPPPPPMAPPPPPTQNTFQHPLTTHLPYEVAVPPPPNMAPPPPPPPVNMALQQQPAPTYQPPETIFSPSPNMIPPPPPIMAPQKSLPKVEQFPKTSAPSVPKMPPPPPPLLLPPNDYSLPSSRQNDVSKPDQINHPKKSPPPPPQRDMMQHNNFPQKPARDASSFKFFSNTSQTSVANTKSSRVAGSPEVNSQPLIASTFNPKATAKLFGFSNPVNKSESSLDSDWQNKSKSMIVMKDAEQYPMDHTAYVLKTDKPNKGTEHATMNKMHRDSVPYKPQKPARKNNLSMQQSKSFQNKGVHPTHSGSSTDHSMTDGKENTWSKNMDLQQTSTCPIHNSTNTPSFSSNPPVSAGMEFEKYRAEQKPKSTMKRDFENQSSSENPMFDFQSPKSVENPKTPESPPEQTLASTERNTSPRSPLALLVAAKERDSSKNQGLHKISCEIPNLSLGGTRYIKSATSNTIHITPVADNKESSLLSHAEGDTTPKNKHVDDILRSLNSAEKSGKWSKPSLHSTSCRISELEDTENDVDMSLLLIPPPPNFSDAENEKPSMGLLPPPFEFSNHDDNQDYSFQPERKVNNESGVNNLHNSNRGLSIQQPTPDPPNHKNSLINKNSSSMNKFPLNPVLTPAKTGFNKQKPSIGEKSTFVDSAVMNGGSTKFHNSKQVSDSHTYSHLMSKTSGKNVSKVGPQQTETVPTTNHLLAKNKVMDELQSKVQGLSTKSSAAASPSSQNAQVSQTYGRTFTVRPGTKQPITVVYPPTTK
ncbi:xin actin-binding repeat-containing protein 2-like isoform X2 [Scyliorhinus canicula]|nr:xin actin-binding repeat-containing protein 2-like isoform X2 [Scyliorhinus canicula]XP_038676165.1 xin actin-binding repeat-containing protein 2-like isoform X2 [Scyliorhinus canicula]